MKNNNNKSPTEMAHKNIKLTRHCFLYIQRESCSRTHTNIPHTEYEYKIKTLRAAICAHPTFAHLWCASIKRWQVSFVYFSDRRHLFCFAAVEMASSGEIFCMPGRILACIQTRFLKCEQFLLLASCCCPLC